MNTTPTLSVVVPKHRRETRSEYDPDSTAEHNVQWYSRCPRCLPDIYAAKYAKHRSDR